MTRYERAQAEWQRLVAEKAPVDKLKPVARVLDEEERWRREFPGLRATMEG